MNDSVAERVASVFSLPVHIGKETGADEESIYAADGGFVCECNSKSRARVISEALNAISTLTAAKDAEIDALRTELTALREAAEGAKKRVAISRDLLAGNLNKGASRDDVADLYSRLSNIEKQLSTALSPAADE